MQMYEKLVKLRETKWRYEAWAELCECQVFSMPNSSEPDTPIYQISHHLSHSFPKVHAVTWQSVCFSHLSGTLQPATAYWPAKARAAWPRLEISGWLETFTGEIFQHSSLTDVRQQDMLSWIVCVHTLGGIARDIFIPTPLNQEFLITAYKNTCINSSFEHYLIC